MRVAKRVGAGFDLLDSETETNTSLVRNSNLVRISYTEGGLVQLVKNDVATASIGTLLVSHGEHLVPTGDRQSGRTVARLLAPKESAAETKQVQLNGSTATAYLLPIQVL